MKSIFFLALVESITAFPTAEIPEWHPKGDGEVRGPCPGINVLANHGILPRSGRDMDRTMIVDALSKWYNINETISVALFERALNTTGRPNATTFDMVDIRLHHAPLIQAIEQDASFSRADHYWGDNYSLNYTVWNQTHSFWQIDAIDVQKFGNAAKARYLTSKETNPTFYFPDVTLIGGAMSFMTNVLGDAAAGTVPTRFVEDWIVNERLPTHLGWSTNQKPTTADTLADLRERIFAASGLGPTTGVNAMRGGFMHAGVQF